MSIGGITSDELVVRAMRNMRATRSGSDQPLWVAVMDVFGLGSTYACELCRKYGRDPDEMIKPRSRGK